MIIIVGPPPPAPLLTSFIFRAHKHKKSNSWWLNVVPWLLVFSCLFRWVLKDAAFPHILSKEKQMQNIPRTSRIDANDANRIGHFSQTKDQFQNFTGILH